MTRRTPRTRWGGLIGTAAVLATAAGLIPGPVRAADEPAPAATPPAAAAAVEAAGVVVQIEVGRKTYTSYCTRCHGINLVSNGLGYDLRNFPRDDKARFIRSVSNGVRAMPAWVGLLKPEDMDAIWAYIGSVNGWGTAAPPQ